MFRDTIERPSDQVPEGMTAEDISAQQHNIHNENEASDPNSETVGKVEGDHCVVRQKTPHRIGKPQEIAMKILQN
jgi:hypothetical protein